jgi:dCMP deaminase
VRQSWDQYFIKLAQVAATRSTCLATPVGAVIVRNNRILATGYNSPPSGDVHCTEQGHCYVVEMPQSNVNLAVGKCSESSLPSRAIHAEVNAIGQAARHGIAVEGAIIYVTLQPCLNCLKACMAAGISEVRYLHPNPKASNLFDHIINQVQL